MARRKQGLQRHSFSVRDLAESILTAAQFHRIVDQTQPELREAVRAQIYALLVPSVRAEVDAQTAAERVQ